MNRQGLKRLRLPDAPGVYFFLGKRNKILYIGRATSLRDRIRSYFAPDIGEVRSPLISKMVQESVRVDVRITDSVLEAILIEADLIRKFKPPYNTDEKDDKSFNCVVVTGEEYPRVLVIRKKDLESGEQRGFVVKKVFGPFSEGRKLQLALKIIRKILPFRDTCIPNAGKPCFNAQVGLCPGVCTGTVSVAEYKNRIRDISSLFSGKKSEIISRLSKEMKTAIRALKFEKAGELHRTIEALKNIRDVSLIGDTRIRPNLKGSAFRIEAYDVSHISGTARVGVMTVVEDGAANKSQYRKFKIQNPEGGDTGALREMLTRRFGHEEWRLPDVIAVDGSTAQRRAAEDIVRKAIIDPRFWMPVVAVTKDEHHRPKKIQGDARIVRAYEADIVLANAEAHRFSVAYHRKLRGKGMRGL